MDATAQHTHMPDTTLDGGSLDCGGGLLLLIRRAIDPCPPVASLKSCPPSRPSKWNSPRGAA